jgi:hypothetical protein
MAFAALGAIEVLAAHPGHDGARLLLADALPAVGAAAAGSAGDPTAAGWPWPEPRLAYANAAVAEALIGGGAALGDPAVVRGGLALLAWLFEVQEVDGHLSPVPAAGWAPGEARPGFDQQPIEVAALADAAARALTVTGDTRWATRAQRCIAWFAGDNDSGLPMWDPVTAGGYDGLERGGRNANQGAESTLAALSTLQWARQMGVARC